MKINILLFFCFIILSCNTNKKLQITKNHKSEISLWHHKDLALDSIPGISLEKWYAENSNKKTKNEIIVATLDSQIDLNHEDLQGQIWVNKKEIPNNGIDDDKNGYIDDVNGWNFIGLENNQTLAFSNFEFVRYINQYKKQFETNFDTIYNLKTYTEYKRAKKKYETENSFYSGFLMGESLLAFTYYPAKDTLKYYFPKEDYTIEQLDSLYQVYKKNDKTFYDRFIENDSSRDFPDLIVYMKTFKQFGKNIEELKKSRNHYDSIVNKLLNFNYDDRIKIKNIQKEKGYGNNNLNSNKRLRNHNTGVSSIIAANRNNNMGTQGFHPNIKIMPLNISPFGDEHDKDIANAIYYAVDNGAKIINMSFCKEFSVDQKLVTNAMKYAEKHNVLIIHVSGNGSSNIDSKPFYPSDIDYLEDLNKELVNNLITVGSISKKLDSTFVANTSNYGKQNVDLFAPGVDIFLAKPDNEYDYNSGTSFATPLVSGTAALIWLYYPNLTAQEVKNIILESGITIDKMVIKPGIDDEMVHFSELCKTGKILNTYKAMQMAKEISQKKK